MSTHLSGFQSFSGFLCHSVSVKLDSSNIRVDLQPENDVHRTL